MTEWVRIAAVVRGAVNEGLNAIRGWVGRRRPPRSRSAVEMDDERRRVLRQIAAADYSPKRHDRKETAP